MSEIRPILFNRDMVQAILVYSKLSCEQLRNMV